MKFPSDKVDHSPYENYVAFRPRKKVTTHLLFVLLKIVPVFCLYILYKWCRVVFSTFSSRRKDSVLFNPSFLFLFEFMLRRVKYNYWLLNTHSIINFICNRICKDFYTCNLIGLNIYIYLYINDCQSFVITINYYKSDCKWI